MIVMTDLSKVYRLGMQLCTGSSSDLYEAIEEKGDAAVSSSTTNSSAEYLLPLPPQHANEESASALTSASREQSPQIDRKQDSTTIATPKIGHYHSNALASSSKVIKMVRRRKFSKRLYNEFDIMVRLQHPNILHPDNVVYIPGTGLGMIMPRIHGSDLFVLLTGDGSDMPNSILYSICRSVAHAVDYLHSRRFVHGDIKLDNVLVEYDEPSRFRMPQPRDYEPRVLLCDFEFAFRLEEPPDRVTKKQIITTGSTEYICMEMLYGLPVNPYASDVWSLGATLGSMLINSMILSKHGLGEMIEKTTLTFPMYMDFLENEHAERKWWKQRALFKSKRYRNVPKRYRAVIEQCLQFSEVRRATAHQIKEQLH